MSSSRKQQPPEGSDLISCKKKKKKKNYFLYFFNVTNILQASRGNGIWTHDAATAACFTINVKKVPVFDTRTRDAASAACYLTSSEKGYSKFEPMTPPPQLVILG